MSDVLLQTPLLDRHLALGARMVPFAGWNMPVQYPDGILAEHRHCRTKTALFDICHMGEFRLSGSRAAADLDYILPRPVLDQPVGTCRYNFLLNEQAGILDDLIVYRMAENEFYLVVNAGTQDNDAAWIQKHLSAETTFVNESAQTAKLDLQGPLAATVLAEWGVPMEQQPAYFRFQKVTCKGINILLSRTGYTGEKGFELYFPVKYVGQVWDELLQIDEVKPAGLGARDTLRLEMGFSLYGHELDENTTPVEAGFKNMLKLEKERNFIGAKVLRDQSKGKPQKKLLAFQLESKRAARAGAAIIANGETVGQVTSGAVAPSLEVAVAMGYVKEEAELPIGSKVMLEAGKAMLTATVVELPFYRQGTVRD